MRWTILLTLLGCGSVRVRPYPTPTMHNFSEVLQARGIQSLRAETRSDVRLGKDRAKVTVLMLLQRGGRLRFLAQNPNHTTAAELASNGERYCFLDANHNCGECGSATPENVARLIRLVLPPADIVMALFGGTPVLEDAPTTLEWDAKRAMEHVVLRAPNRVQHVWLKQERSGFNVHESAVEDGSGKVLWRIRHKDFHTLAKGVALPRRSLFEQGKESILIQWKTQEINIEVRPEQFQLELPKGLPLCAVQ